MYKTLLKIRDAIRKDKDLRSLIKLIFALIILLFAVFMYMRHSLHNPLIETVEAGGIDITYGADLAPVAEKPEITPIALSVAETALKDAVVADKGYIVPLSDFYGADRKAISLAEKLRRNSGVTDVEYLEIRNRGKTYNQIIKALNTRVLEARAIR